MEAFDDRKDLDFTDDTNGAWDVPLNTTIVDLKERKAMRATQEAFIRKYIIRERTNLNLFGYQFSVDFPYIGDWRHMAPFDAKYVPANFPAGLGSIFHYAMGASLTVCRLAEMCAIANGANGCGVYDLRAFVRMLRRRFDELALHNEKLTWFLKQIKTPMTHKEGLFLIMFNDEVAERTSVWSTVVDGIVTELNKEEEDNMELRAFMLDYQHKLRGNVAYGSGQPWML